MVDPYIQDTQSVSNENLAFVRFATSTIWPHLVGLILVWILSKQGTCPKPKDD